jgi:hypothetical protein
MTEQFQQKTLSMDMQGGGPGKKGRGVLEATRVPQTKHKPLRSRLP